MLVKPPQSRRGKGYSVVHRVSGGAWGCDPGEIVYVKTQTGYFCRPAWRAWRLTPTLAREVRCLRACHTLGLAVPEVIAYREFDGAAELVLRSIPGAPCRSAQIPSAQSIPGRRRLEGHPPGLPSNLSRR